MPAHVMFGHSSAGLREQRQYEIDCGEIVATSDVACALEWAANEIDRLNALVEAADHRTSLVEGEKAQDYRARNRVWGILAWHVNRTHANLSDRDLALAAFREYEKHWGRALIDPNE